ncbi:MAG: diadenylate cyclase CdaA [Bacilli bacterium]
MSDSLIVVWDIIRIILDLSIVAIGIYLLLRLIKNNARMMLLFKGIIVVLLLQKVAKVLQLTTIEYLLSYILANGFIIVIIIFHPEIRQALEQLGRNKLFFGKHRDLSLTDRDKIVKELKQTVNLLSSKKIGAIITLEQNESLYEFISKGHHLFSDVTSEILISMFITDSPLHDGAVIIQGNKIACAKAYYPITHNPLVGESFGTRHRASIGISEISDCITLVVSEETGTISVTHLGVIFYDLTLNEMEEKLRELYLDGEVSNEYVEEEKLISIHEENYESEYDLNQKDNDMIISSFPNDDFDDIDKIVGGSDNDE